MSEGFDIAIQEHRDVGVGGSDLESVEQVHGDLFVGASCEFDATQIAIDVEACAEGFDESKFASRSGAYECAINVPQDQLAWWVCRVLVVDVFHQVVSLAKRVVVQVFRGLAKAFGCWRLPVEKRGR